MNNKEYEKKLQSNDLSKTDVSEFIEYCQSIWLKTVTTELVMDYVGFVEAVAEGAFDPLIEQEAALKPIYEGVLELVTNPLDLFDNKLQSEAVMADLRSYRSTLTQMVHVLSAYEDYMDMIEHIHAPNVMRTQLAVDIDAISGELIHYVYKDETHMVIQSKIQALLKQLPLRLTKARFYDLITPSVRPIQGITEDQLDQFYTYIQEIFAPESVPGFGERFGFIHERLIQMKHLVAKGKVDDIMTTETLRQIDTTMDDIDLDVQNCQDGLLVLVCLVNSLIAIGHLLALSENRPEAHMDQVISTMQHVTPTKDQAEVIDDLVHHLLTKLEGVIEEQVLKLERLESLLDQSMTLSLEPEALLQMRKLKLCYALNSGSLFFDMDALLKGTSSIPVDAIMIAKKLEALKQSMNGWFEKDDRQWKRTRMNFVFGHIPFSESKPKELHAFIYNQLLSCEDQQERICRIEMLKLIMQQDDTDDWLA